MQNQITPLELKTRLNAGETITIIDVREPWEVDIASVADTLNIPMNSIPEALDRIPKNVPVAILCHHGNRSNQVTQWLRIQGYVNVINITGGIARWAEEIDPTIPQY